MAMKSNIGINTAAAVFCSVLFFTFCGSPAALSAEQQELELSAQKAILMAMENNESLKIQKLNPQLRKQAEEVQKAAFDTGFTATVSKSSSESASGAGTHGTQASAQVSRRLEAGEELSISIDSSNGGSGAFDYSSGFSVSLTKPVMRGAGGDVNLAGVRQARLGTEISGHELQAYAESIVNQVIDTYWNLALQEKKVGIYEESLGLAQEQLEETRAYVEVGKSAGVELVAARAEVALRKQSLVNVRSQYELYKLRLMRLINPAGLESFADVDIVVTDALAAPAPPPGDLESHVAAALEARPDLKEARLSLESNQLEVVQTKNGLLPYLGLFVTYGASGYADSFGGAAGDIFDDGYDLRAGLAYSYDFGRRRARALDVQAAVNLEQSELAISNLELLVREEVHSAWIEADRARSQIDAAAATLELQQEKYRTESEKYRVGRSTALNVAIAQRDLLQSRLDEAQALADYTTALAALARAEGALLQRNNISIY